MSAPHAGSAPPEAVPVPPAGPDRSPTLSETVRTRLRAWRLWIILGLVLCFVVLLAVLGGSGDDDTALSPANPAPAGAQAAATILGNRGVDVQAPDSYQEAVDMLQRRGGQSTLFLYDPNGFLGADQLAELNGLARRQVLVEPGFVQLTELAPEIRSAGVLPEQDAGLEAQCDAADASAAQNIDAGGLAYRGPVTCFPASDGGTGAGSYAGNDDGSVIVLGNSALLANESLANRGNAALALRTLGSAETLVWFLPTVSDVPPAEAPADFRTLLPGWVDPLLLWLLVVAALAMLWRGRRLGPLAAEPMPVVVRSAETAEGRARLYQDARATDRAAQTLRAAALTRLAARLRLGPGSSTDTVVRAVAASTGRPEDEVNSLLNGALPAGDAALVQWSQDLQALEEEVTAS
ncbi:MULTISPECIES: DUF4350 domain-containing protein [unclassified Arthrobacter]|uniref:DUF4350 domain-containing protein n=1 Tax=unclassified Arthrobacter TaxID=235627 RepID=UPI000CE4771F|nr:MULTISPECIES: DUF4350 domain-containing protein [unclassified Arthrobacter]